ncbi:extracellular solute-binding protein [Jonesiaceae bacterium BS-20]|uniref:Extracellular solute-binding protein n=1 Tax=Jonesiaceae bacterium BS-20 TaxID=3120821 RepID=A0AAU7DVL7_9MICO
MKKKFTTSLGAVAMTLALVGLTACGSEKPTNQPKSEGPVTVDFWYSVSGQPADTLVALVDEFNASQDATKVNAIFQGNYADTMAKLTNAVQSGGLPPLLQGGDTFTSYLKDTGLSVSPTEVKNSKGETFDPETLVPYLRDYYTIDDQLRSVPIMASQPVVFYNPEILARAGVSTDSPASLPDLFANAAAIHESTSTPGVTFQLNEWFSEVFSAGIGVDYCLVDNGLGAEPASSFNIASAPQVALWTEVQGLLDSGAMFNVGTDGAAAQTAFANGNAGMVIASTGVIGNLTEAATFDFGIWPLPTSNSGGAVPGGSSVWLLQDGIDETQQQAAADFVHFLASQESQTKVFSETGFLPSNSEALTALLVEAEGTEKVVLDQLNASQSTTAALGCHSGAMGEMRPGVRSALESISGGTVPADALQNAQEQANAALEKYNSRL